MKIFLIVLFLTLTSFVSFAQTKADSSKHLTFKGVPLNGTLAQYVSKMKQNGFKLLSTEDGVAILQGDFAGYKDCNVGVSTLNQKDLVYKIAVFFSKKDTWLTLSGNYFDLKEMLTEKYGNPSEVVEKFDAKYEPKDDGSKMYEVQFDHCKYKSIWDTEKGEIQLFINHNDITSCFVTLAYFDKINGATIKKQALDDL